MDAVASKPPRRWREPSLLPGFGPTLGLVLVYLSLVVLLPMSALAARPWEHGIAGVLLHPAFQIRADGRGWDRAAAQLIDLQSTITKVEDSLRQVLTNIAPAINRRDASSDRGRE